MGMFPSGLGCVGVIGPVVSRPDEGCSLRGMKVSDHGVVLAKNKPVLHQSRMLSVDPKNVGRSTWDRLRRLPERQRKGSSRVRINWWRPSALNAALAIVAIGALSIWAILSGRGLARGGFFIFTMLPLAGLLAIGFHIRVQERIDMRSDSEPLQPLNPIRGADVDELI